MKFYEKEWFFYLMLLFCYPVGLFLMWKYKRFPIVIRIIFSIVLVGATCEVFLETQENKNTINLGVSTKSVEKAFKKQGFKFEKYKSKDGTITLSGESPSKKGDVSLDLYENGKGKLKKASLMITASMDNTHNNNSIFYSMLLIRQIWPNYNEFSDWFTMSLKKLKSKPNEEIVKIIDNKKISMRLFKNLAIINLKIEPN